GTAAARRRHAGAGVRGPRRPAVTGPAPAPPRDAGPAGTSRGQPGHRPAVIEEVFEETRPAMVWCDIMVYRTGGLTMPMAHSADSDDQELSRRQREILQFNGDFIRDNGYPPTMREIASGVGLASPSSVAYQVSALKKKGLLSHSARRSRSAVVRV